MYKDSNALERSLELSPTLPIETEQLVTRPSNPVLDALVDSLLSDPDSAQRLSSLRKLEELGVNDYCLEVEHALYFDPDPSVRVEAAYILSRSSGPSPIPFIIESTFCADQKICEEGIRLLNNNLPEIGKFLPKLIERYRFSAPEVRPKIVDLVAHCADDSRSDVISFLKTRVVSEEDSLDVSRTAARHLAEIDRFGSSLHFSALLKPAAFLSHLRRREQIGAVVALVEFAKRGDPTAIEQQLSNWLAASKGIGARWFLPKQKITEQEWVGTAIGIGLRNIAEYFLDPFKSRYRERFSDLACTVVVAMQDLKGNSSQTLINSGLSHPIPEVKKAAEQALRRRLDKDTVSNVSLVQGWVNAEIPTCKILGELIKDFKLSVLIPGVVESLRHTHEPYRRLAAEILKNVPELITERHKSSMMQIVRGHSTHLAIETLDLIEKLNTDFTKRLSKFITESFKQPNKLNEDVVIHALTVLSNKAGGLAMDLILDASLSGTARVKQHASQLYDKLRGKLSE